MTPDLRAAIAAVCISDTCGSAVYSLYDHDAGSRLNVEAQVGGGRAVSCDRDSGHSFGGDLPELWYAPAEAWVHLGARGGGVYEGHDRTADTAFAVRVSGAVAQLYDHDRQAWSAYTADLIAAAF
ncbi:MAG TPA: hypothetical protein VGC56_09070 [Allosphingosinicella sp.]|jgi:hypothetical protein